MIKGKKTGHYGKRIKEKNGRINQRRIAETLEASQIFYTRQKGIEQSARRKLRRVLQEQQPLQAMNYIPSDMGRTIAGYVNLL